MRLSDLIPSHWSNFCEKISVRFGRCQLGDFGMEKSRFSEQQIAFILKQAEEERRSRRSVGRPAHRSRPIIDGAVNIAG